MRPPLISKSKQVQRNPQSQQKQIEIGNSSSDTVLYGPINPSHLFEKAQQILSAIENNILLEI